MMTRRFKLTGRLACDSDLWGGPAVLTLLSICARLGGYGFCFSPEARLGICQTTPEPSLTQQDRSGLSKVDYIVRS
jgi:hypothetical protein